MDVIKSVESINIGLKQYFVEKEPMELYQPMDYMVGLDTGRFYPLLTLWGCYLISGDVEKAVNPAIGVEVFYKFLSVHSDLIDGSQQRHQWKAVHEKWNRNVAILSGDAMIFKSYELLIKVPSRLIKPVIRKFNRCFTLICEGKQKVINHPEIGLDPDMLKLYPGALGEFSLFLGALLGGGDQEQKTLASDLGVATAIFSMVREESWKSNIFQYLDRFNCPGSRKEAFRSWVNGIHQFVPPGPP